MFGRLTDIILANLPHLTACQTDRLYCMADGLTDVLSN